MFHSNRDAKPVANPSVWASTMSSIPRATHAGSYTHAGPEIGVASTKAFTAQVTVLTLMALHVAHKKGSITNARLHRLLIENNADYR